MTDTTLTPVDETGRHSMPLQGAQLPRYAPGLAAGIAVGIAVLAVLLGGVGAVAAVMIGWVLLAVGLPAWSRAVEGPRKAADRVAGVLVWSAFALAMIPLVSLVWTVVSKGLPILSAQFFQNSMRGILGEGGGIYHAVMGTLIITALATLISVPIGVLSAIYLVEYGKGSKLARVITFLVDVMTGIPSIVAGLFAYALFVIFFGPGVRMGFGGSVALSVLMIPIVVRATEEMLKLVPDELREASYALGVPKWRTIVKVVLPTAVAGIVTGVTLAVARVAGETAPLLIIAGLTTGANFNPFSERMATLPVFIFYAITEPGIYDEEMAAYAWGAALTLVTLVMVLNVAARVIGSVFAPKTGR
ncbi:phosphate ABC transporter permease PstA [Nocardioides cremeus]|uniref:Phosphate transport system permease protein PstA n=1 Tax=Nocardioides cremeus TaxID=3058044 RepID=A0ABT8TSG1_9ACTN|nr:phosphate ABC transporter permease PstA [Nocardioides cremeus]MDO3396893.1 phosphate ABC transporter permease PstA [Nocardioides cremeus]